MTLSCTSPRPQSRRSLVRDADAGVPLDTTAYALLAALPRTPIAAFDPLPSRRQAAMGMSSTQAADTRRLRASLPPVVGVGVVGALAELILEGWLARPEWLSAGGDGRRDREEEGEEEEEETELALAWREHAGATRDLAQLDDAALTALTDATAAERAVDALVARGYLRRMLVPAARGGGQAGLGGLGEMLVGEREWEDAVRRALTSRRTGGRTSDQVGGEPEREEARVDEALAGMCCIPARSVDGDRLSATTDMGAAKFVTTMRARPKATMLPLASTTATDSSPTLATFTPPEHARLVHAGLATADGRLAMPNMGPFLRLRAAGRAHLLGLLERSGGGGGRGSRGGGRGARGGRPGGLLAPRSAAATGDVCPLGVLRMRWDGTDTTTARSGRSAAGRSRKWRHLAGMSFRWVLAEAVAAGAVEVSPGAGDAVVRRV